MEASRIEISQSPGNWREILQQTPADDLELLSILKRQRVTALVAYLLLAARLSLGARCFWRMEVRGTRARGAAKASVSDLSESPELSRSTFGLFCLSAAYSAARIPCGRQRILEQRFSPRRFARLINIVPVDPDTNLIRAMRAGAAGLRAGRILNIYPEGERSFDGLLHQFKRGAAILASELDVPLYRWRWTVFIRSGPGSHDASDWLK